MGARTTGGWPAGYLAPSVAGSRPTAEAVAYSTRFAGASSLAATQSDRSSLVSSEAGHGTCDGAARRREGVRRVERAARGGGALPEVLVNVQREVLERRRVS